MNSVGSVATIFVSGIITIAALSLIFAPQSTVARVIESLGSSMSSVIGAAKNYPK